MNVPTPLEIRVQELEDRQAISDVLYRLAAGVDLADAELLATTVTDNVVVDLGPATRKIGFDFPVLEGSEQAIGTLLHVVGALDTSHSITNVLVALDGDTAAVTANVMAQHFRPGEGPRPDRTAHALMMNRYTVDFTRTRDGWRMHRIIVDSAWFEGDPTILIPQEA